MGYPKGSHSGSHMGSIEYSPKWKKKQQRISKKFQKKYERNCGKCITTKASKEEIERLIKEMEWYYLWKNSTYRWHCYGRLYAKSV